MRKIMRKSFAALGYTVKLKVMNTAEHSIPQSRNRVYIVAIRSPVQEFKFPKKTNQKPPLRSFLQTQTVGDVVLDLTKFEARLSFPVERLWQDHWVLDIGSSERFSSVPCPKKNGKVAPCLTKSRGAQGGYYVPKLRRYLCSEEVCGLQGWPIEMTKKMIQTLEEKRPGYDAKKRDHIVAGAAGDGMSVNVVMRVLANALQAAGMWPTKVRYEDVWKTVAASEAHELADSLFHSRRPSY